MGKCKEDITPLLMHWSDTFLALTHLYVFLGMHSFEMLYFTVVYLYNNVVWSSACLEFRKYNSSDTTGHKLKIAASWDPFYS